MLYGLAAQEQQLRPTAQVCSGLCRPGVSALRDAGTVTVAEDASLRRIPVVKCRMTVYYVIITYTSVLYSL